MTDYDGLAQYYDAEWKNLKNDLPFLRDEVKKTGGPVLELACGTGRVMFPLIEDGHTVWGIDNSKEMLRILDEKVMAASPEVSARAFISQQDMRTFSFDQKFKTVIIPFNSILLITERPDFDKCLSNCHDHLEDDGKFIVDIYAPNFGLCAEKEPKINFLQHFFEPSIGKVVIQWEMTTRDMAKQTIVVDFLYEEYNADGTINQKTRSIKMSIMFRYEMQYLLEKNGFVVEEMYGDYDRSEFMPESPQMIFICSKKAK